MSEPEAYYDDQTGVVLVVYPKEHPKGFLKKVLFTRQVEADEMVAAITRLEDRAFPDEPQGGQPPR